MNNEELPKINKIEDLSNLTHLTISGLNELKKDKNYRKFSILKKNGTKREINAPNFKLKVLQKWILVNILEKDVPSEQSMAFVKGKFGIKINAETHLNNKYILEIDLKDFYPSITLFMVTNLFKKFGYSEDVSYLLAQFCIYKKKLPQGGVTSPAISNLICKNLDKRLKSYCDKHLIVYTRYADDLTFSANEKSKLIKLEKDIKLFIHQEKFIINDEKTRLLSPKSHKRITGITVNNGELKANKKIKRKIRAILYHSIKNNSHIIKQDANKKFRNTAFSSKDELLGCIAYVKSLESDYAERLNKYCKQVAEKFYATDIDLFKIIDKMTT